METFADEGYEQNVRTNVLRCQKVVAVFIKENMANSDPFDETFVVQLVEQRVKGMGHDQDSCDEQMMRLMTFMPGEGAAKPCRKPNWTTTGPVVLVEEPADTVEVKSEQEAQMEEAMSSGGEAEAPTDVVPLEKVAGMFVVSIVGRSKTKTLHRIGECHRQPGVHYAQFEVLGEEAPSASAYHKACRQCFRKGISEAEEARGEEESSGEVSSSEMTETDEESAG